MDRHNSRHQKSRVELPAGISRPRAPRVLSLLRRRRVRPVLGAMLGLMSFVTGGVAVVATASLLALQIQ